MTAEIDLGGPMFSMPCKIFDQECDQNHERHDGWDRGQTSEPQRRCEATETGESGCQSATSEMAF